MFLFLILILVGLINGTRLILARIKYFSIKKIEIAGNQNLEQEFLSNLVKDYLGKNLFAIPKKEIITKYDNVIRIKSVRVKRVIPYTLKIIVNERTAKFCLRTTQGDIYPLDSEKILLDKDNFYPRESMPIISSNLKNSDLKIGAKINSQFINEVYDFCSRISNYDPSFVNRISEFYRMKDEIYMIDNNTGYTIVFGDNDLEDKYRRFAFLEKNRNFATNTLIDLRFEDRLIIHPEVQ